VFENFQHDFRRKFMERRGMGGHQACNVDIDILPATWLKHSHVLTLEEDPVTDVDGMWQ